MKERMIRVPVREQNPKVRATNFEEVCLGYNEEEAVKEASRCLNCKNAQCRKGCPVSIDIPAFIAKLKESDFEGAAKEIAKYSALPAVCGRVCPQEKQCEGKCVLGIKGESVSIGKLERFTADWAAAHNVDLSATEPKKGIKVAVIGSGPAGLTCAGDLAKKGYEVTITRIFKQNGKVIKREVVSQDRINPRDKIVLIPPKPQEIDEKKVAEVDAAKPGKVKVQAIKAGSTDTDMAVTDVDKNAVPQTKGLDDQKIDGNSEEPASSDLTIEVDLGVNP